MAALALTTALTAAQSSSSLAASGGQTRTGSASGLELRNLDTTADACTDFFQYACGGYNASHPVPDDQQRWVRFTELQDQVFAQLRRILDDGGRGGNDPDRRRAADFYAACMDEPAIEARGLKPLQPELTAISAMAGTDDLWPEVGRLHLVGVDALFRFGSQPDRRDATRQIARVDEAGLGLPDREYYLKTDARSIDIRQKYRRHVEKMLVLAGDTPERATAAAAAIVAFETKLAEASLDRTARRDPLATDHMTSVNDWRTRTPGITWGAYLKAVEAPEFAQINVAVPSYFTALDRLIASTPLDDIKSYLRWHLTHASVDALPKAFQDEDFDFFSRTLAGQRERQPRWRRCVQQTDARLGDALGKAFVEDSFSASAKADAQKMVREIKSAMQQDIQTTSWMSEDTKRAAIAKLATVVDRIGYPDRWKNYAPVRIARDDAFGNEQRTTAFERRRSIDRIGKPTDRNEWTMTSPTVNAQYNQSRNDISFPAGILQPPFYTQGRDAALNYAGIGAVVGHELTHGFDDQGRKSDAQGNLRNWWTDADAKAYETRSACIADQYSNYIVGDDTHLNGRLTLGENTADNGGLRLALMAYLAGPGVNAADLDGFTPQQRFFLGYAHIWCGLARPEYERRQAATNPHSTGRYRVNGVVSNMPEFQKAFACKADAPMVRRDPCKVW
jgi:endothelin-converting enzyme/putative endopeptidase